MWFGMGLLLFCMKYIVLWFGMCCKKCIVVWFGVLFLYDLDEMKCIVLLFSVVYEMYWFVVVVCCIK